MCGQEGKGRRMITFANVVKYFTTPDALNSLKCLHGLLNQAIIALEDMEGTR